MDVVWMDVLPSMGKFATNLAKESTTAATAAGKQAGSAWTEAMGSSAKGGAALVAELEKAEKSSAGTVRSLSVQISSARAAEASAAANVILAEQKLTAARAQYGEQSAQAQVADLRLQAAREKAEGSTTRFRSAEDQLKAAQREHTAVAGQLKKATEDLGSETDRQPSRWSKFKESLTGGSEAADRAKESLSGLLVKTAAVGAAVVTAASAAGLGAFNIGQGFDDMSDTIRVGTGESGASLDELMGVAKQVGATVPVDFAQVGPAVADLNATLGFTGDTLETVAAQALQVGRMTGEALNIQDLSSTLSGFKVGANDASSAVDGLFRVSQATGVKMNTLTANLSTQGGVLQELGFDYLNSASLIGVLTKSGVNAETVVRSMQAGLVKLAKSGEEPQDAFRRVIGEIQGFIDAGDDAAALTATGEIFGTRGAAQIVAALKNAKGGFLELSDAAGLSGDTILGVATETNDFSEQWQLVKNNAQLALEPLGSKVFAALTDVMKGAVPIVKEFASGLGGVVSILLSGDFTGAAATFGWEEDSTQVSVLFTIRDTLIRVKEVAADALKDFGEYVTGTVIPAARDLGVWLGNNRDWLMAIAVGVGVAVLAWKAYQTALVVGRVAVLAFNAVMAVNPIVLIIAAIAALVAGLVYFFTQTETGKQAWASFTAFLSETWATITEALTTAWTSISDFFSGLWTGITGFFAAAWQFMQQVFAWTPIGAIVTNWGAISEFFAGVWGGITGFFSTAWEFMKQVFGWTPIGLITQNWGSIVDFFTELPGRIANAASGMWDGITSSFKSAINWVIGKWNDFKLTIGGGTIAGITMPSLTLDTPNIPLLANGGTAVRPGWSVVGDRGPELAYLNTGAMVVPLNERAGAGAGNPWAGGVHIEHAELGGSLAELAAEVDWRSRR